MKTKVLKEENKKNEKGYQIIIKNLDTGEDEINETTRAIIGAFAIKTPEGVKGIDVQSIVVTSCNTATLIATIEGADKVVAEAKSKVIEGFLGDNDNPLIALLSMLGDKK